MSATPARRLAREVASRVREDVAYAHEVMAAALTKSSLSSEDAAFATRLAYGALQMQGTIDEALERYLDGRRLEPRVRDALRIAAYEVLFLRTHDRAAVHQGVELVKTVRPQASGLANAVLRRLSEEAPTFPWGDPETDTAVLARATGHPEWIAELWVRELGRDAAAAVMAADNEPAPLFVALNPFCGASDAVASVLAADGVDVVPGPVAGSFVALDTAAAVRSRALADGAVFAVDAAAQLVAALASARPGQTVVEIGAGRGTKTVLLQAAAVAAGGPAELFAVDLHAYKTHLLRQRMDAWHVPSVRALTGDATAMETIDGIPTDGTADAVLIDAPCSGLGTLRRHPEKRWRVTPADVEALAALGLSLLTESARLVRPGGFVVYSTCTLTNAENADVIAGFLGTERGSEFAVEPLGSEVPEQWARFVTSEGYFRSLPERGGADGHFAARLVRRA